MKIQHGRAFLDKGWRALVPKGSERGRWCTAPHGATLQCGFTARKQARLISPLWQRCELSNPTPYPEARCVSTSPSAWSDAPTARRNLVDILPD